MFSPFMFFMLGNEWEKTDWRPFDELRANGEVKDLPVNGIFRFPFVVGCDQRKSLEGSNPL